MGLFNLFKKPTIIQDDLFGPLRLRRSKDPSKNFFSGRGHFTPTDSQVGYSMLANGDRPTEEQRQFYRSLEANYNQYIEKMKLVIEDDFKNWKDDFKITDFNQQFRLDYITIPKIDTRPLVWEMTFIYDVDHYISIDFTDDQPNGILIDG